MSVKTFLIMMLLIYKTTSQLIDSHDYQCLQDGPMDLSRLFPADADAVRCFACKCTKGKAICDQVQHVLSCQSFFRKSTKRNKSGDNGNNYPDQTVKPITRLANHKVTQNSNNTYKMDIDFNQLGQPISIFATGLIQIKKPTDIDVV